MKRPTFTAQFQKDIRFAEKRGKDLIKIKAIMFDIICENPLPAKNSGHPLTGDYKGYRECHIEPDWLLIYMYKDDEVRFVRTGTHSDLF
jgi:addiction module toxin, RelE/StbE family